MMPICKNGSEFSAGELFIPRRGQQGCQMVCFQTENPNLGKFGRVLTMEDNVIFYRHLIYIFYDNLVNFTDICYILWLFGIIFPVLVSCNKKYLVTLVVNDFFGILLCFNRSRLCVGRVVSSALAIFVRFFKKSKSLQTLLNKCINNY
jgi:hypothetical protein